MRIIPFLGGDDPPLSALLKGIKVRVEAADEEPGSPRKVQA